MECSVRRVTSFAVLASLLSAAGAAMAQQPKRPKWDMELPSYPVEAAACAALTKGGTASFTYDPFTIAGMPTGSGAQITGSIVPRTPLFLFYADHEDTFFPNEIAFSPSMRCALNAGLDPKGLMEFANVPDGDYIIFVFNSRLVAWSGTNLSVGHGYDIFGGPVTVETRTPTSGQTRHTRIYAQKFDLRGGKVTSTAPPLQLIDW